MEGTIQKVSIGIVVVAVLFLGGVAFYKNQKPVIQNPSIQIPAAVDPKNLTYVIDNSNVTLVNGFSETQVAPGGASKITTRYFGNEAFGDLNGDGKEDMAFILTQQTGGSGTFFYLAGALKTNAGWQPLNTIFLGDRISPQTTQIASGTVTVNYADRKPGEAMVVAPSVGVSKYFKIEDGELELQMDRANFGTPVSLVANQQVKFEDGLVVTLTQINDSRCKTGVVCVWAGELSPVLSVVGGGIGASAQEVILGTSKTKQVIKNNYTFELKDASVTLATIVVTKK